MATKTDLVENHLVKLFRHKELLAAAYHRGVVSKARENLGAQFKLAAQNRDWKSCVMLGRRIMSEFPNTRMAEEVRAMWDGILTKANAAAAAGVANMPAVGESVGAGTRL